MAVKGAEEKQLVLDKIKEMFPGSFEYDKVLRIPVGEVQIKVSLTCAKDNVEPDGGVAGIAATTPTSASPVVNTEPVIPTSEEINEVENLMAKLGL